MKKLARPVAMTTTFFATKRPSFLLQLKRKPIFLQRKRQLGENAKGALVLWLLEETHVLKVVGSNSGTIYWKDIFHKYFLQKLYCLFEKTENKRKSGPGLPIKKIFNKQSIK